MGTDTDTPPNPAPAPGEYYGPGFGPDPGGGLTDTTISGDEEEYLMRLMIAEAGGEGELGMAAVARSVKNRAGLIQSGEVGSGTFMSDSGSITDVIEGSGQYQPFREGKLNRSLTEEERARARKALNLEKDKAAFRDALKQSGMNDTDINNIEASTGFRTHSAGYDGSQDVNPTRLGGHQFNTAGNAKMLTPSAKIEKVEDAPAPPHQYTVPTNEIPKEGAPKAEWDAYFARLDAMDARPPAAAPPPSSKPKVDLMKLFSFPTSPAQQSKQQQEMSMFTPPSTQIGRRAPQQTGS